jgi:hypothetical protein
MAEDNEEFLNRTSYKSSRQPIRRNSRERSSRWWDDYSSLNQFKQQKGSK